MARYTTNFEKLKEAIDCVGGVGELAAQARISYQSIIDWRRGIKSPSQESCQKIEKATGGKVKAKDILPDYPWDDLK